MNEYGVPLTVGSVTFSPNYRVEVPSRNVQTKETIQEDVRRMERELRQLRRVAFSAANVVSLKDGNRMELRIAIDRLDAALNHYTQDKD